MIAEAVGLDQSFLENFFGKSTFFYESIPFPYPQPGCRRRVKDDYASGNGVTAG